MEGHVVQKTPGKGKFSIKGLEPFPFPIVAVWKLRRCWMENTRCNQLDVLCSAVCRSVVCCIVFIVL